MTWNEKEQTKSEYRQNSKKKIYIFKNDKFQNEWLKLK